MKRLGVKFYEDDDIQLRGPAQSGKIKDILSSLRDSILRAYLRGQRTSREIDLLGKALYYQNITISNALKDAKFDMEVQHEVGSAKVIWKNFYDGVAGLIEDEFAEGTQKNVEFEAKFGQVTLAQTLRTSKIAVYTDPLGVKRISTGIKIYLGDGSADPIVTSEMTDRENTVYNCLDGETKTFWIQDDKDWARTAVDVTFPPSLTTRINCITVDPFPFNIVKLINAQYKPIQSSTMQDLALPGFQVFPGLTSAPIRLHFNPVDYGDEIRLILEGTKIDGRTIYGLADLNVEFLEYASSGFIYNDLQIPEAVDAGTIATVTSFEPYYDLDAPAGTQASATVPIKFQLMTTSGTVIYDSQTNGKLTTDSTPLTGFSGETIIRVKTIMNNIGGVTPVLRGYRITYTTT